MSDAPPWWWNNRIGATGGYTLQDQHWGGQWDENATVVPLPSTEWPHGWESSLAIIEVEGHEYNYVVDASLSPVDWLEYGDVICSSNQLDMVRPPKLIGPQKKWRRLYHFLRKVLPKRCFKASSDPLVMFEKLMPVRAMKQLRQQKQLRGIVEVQLAGGQPLRIQRWEDDGAYVWRKEKPSPEDTIGGEPTASYGILRELLKYKRDV